jgi:uncharacterized protein involved in propanediol utilization
MFGIGIANGKFGELLQGALPGQNMNFLVTLPITRYSVARFEVFFNDKSTHIFPSHKTPSHKTKSATLVGKIIKYFGVNCGWKLTIDSELPEGKGLGSSTADMVACARAITRALGKNIPMDVLLGFLKEIEPSDGVMYEGLVCFYHRNVVLHSQLGYLPDLMIMGIDEGGTINTVKFNKELIPYSSSEKATYATLLNEMTNAIRLRDFKKIGAIATASATLHQAIQPKKNFSYLADLCYRAKALGVTVAHSGSCIGILLDKQDPSHQEKLLFIEREMKKCALVIQKFNSVSEAKNCIYQDESWLRTGSV